MLRTDLVPSRHLRNNRSSAIRLRDNPALLVLAPATPAANTSPDFNTAKRPRIVKYIVDHICEPISPTRSTSDDTSAPPRGAVKTPLSQKEQQRQPEGRKKPGKPAAPPSDQPDPKSQRNFTDPESRIMKSKDGFVQAYNAQAAVDASAQIIVAHELTQCGNDQGQLVPLIEAIENNLGRKPDQASADSGYCSESNLEALEAHGVDGYVAPGRAKHPTAANGKIGGPLTQRMRKKIDDGGFETPYRLRKQVVEPVFGQIKQARGFRQFLLRSVEKVRAEWAMICTAHNVLKLFTLANAA